jgi:hypothetical protein
LTEPAPSSQAQIVAVKSAHFGGADAAGGQLAQVGQRQLGAQFALVAEVDSVHFLGADVQRFAVLFDHHFLQCVRFAVDDQRGVAPCFTFRLMTPSSSILTARASTLRFSLITSAASAACAPLPRTAASIAASSIFHHALHRDRLNYRAAFSAAVRRFAVTVTVGITLASAFTAITGFVDGGSGEGGGAGDDDSCDEDGFHVFCDVHFELLVGE